MSDVSVKFNVQGNGLLEYIKKIETAQSQQSSEAMRNAMEQTARGKEQLEIINRQIEAIQKKSKIEGLATRSILLDNKQEALNKNRDFYEGKRNDVFADTKLDEQTKKEKITALTGAENENEQKIKNDYRENLSVTKEQEHQQKIQTQLTKDQLEAIRQSAKENVKAVTSGDLKLGDIIQGAQTVEERLVANLTKEGVSDLKSKETLGNGSSSGFGAAAGTFAYEGLNKIISGASQFSQTQNGFDLLQQRESTIMSTVLGIVGAAIGGIVSDGMGAVAGFGMGSAVGQGVGNFFGGIDMRETLVKQSYLKNKNSLRAMSGLEGDSETSNLEESGVSLTDYLGLQKNIAKQSGQYAGSGKTTTDAIQAERGYGVQENTSAGLIEMMRSSKESDRDLATMIAGVINAGKESYFKDSNVFLNEFLQKFGSLQRELLKTQENVGTATTFSILKQFDSLGGMFATADPRSTGLISTVDAALQNPAGDFQKAFSFMTLKKLHPTMSTFDLEMEQQKGLGSTGFLKETLDEINKMGGGKDAIRFNIASRLGLNGNLSAADKIESGYKEGKFRNFDEGELKNIGGVDFKAKAEENTTDPDKNAAKIINGTLQGETVKAMVEAFENAVKATLSGAVIEMKDGNKIRLFTDAAIRVNAAKTAEDSRRNSVREMEGMRVTHLEQKYGF